MKNNFFKAIQQLAGINAYMQFLLSEENKPIFEEMSQEDFTNLDVLAMTEEQENLLRFLYEASSWIGDIRILPAYVKEAFANVRKNLRPLFEDATAYLLQEPNGSVLLESMKQAKEGKLKQIDYL